MKTHEEIYQGLMNNGIGVYSNEIVSLARPCVRISSAPADVQLLPVGASRLGGRPHMPRGFEWPLVGDRPLHFLAQFDLSRLRDFSCASDLPGSGRLSFFYDAEDQPWGFDPQDVGGWRVVYDDEPVDRLVGLSNPDGEHEEIEFPCCSVTYEEVFSIPGGESPLIEDIGMPDDVLDLYFDFLESQFLCADDDPCHRLFGHAQPIQGDMQLECQLASNGVYVGNPQGYENPRVSELKAGAKDWRLLLQLGTDDNAGMMWGDMGRLYFCIRESDLKDARFQNAWLILQCS